MTLQGTEEIGGFDTLHRGFGDDDHVQILQLSPMGTKTLAGKPFYSISRHGAAHPPFRYGETEARNTLVIAPAQHHRNRVYRSTRRIEYPRIIALMAQSQETRKIIGYGMTLRRGILRRCRHGVHADNRLRPLARRALMMRRPAFVRMRARKP